MNQKVEVLLALMYKLQRDLAEKEMTRDIILNTDKLIEEDKTRLAHACDFQMEEWKETLKRYQQEYQELIKKEVRSEATASAEDSITAFLRRKQEEDGINPPTK